MQILRRMAAVGAVVTLVDLTVLVALVRLVGLGPVGADALAIAVAATASFLLHRRLTVAGDPHFRLVHQPASFVMATVLTGLVDLAVLAMVLGATDSTEPATGVLLAAKAAALLAAGALRAIVYRGVLFTMIHVEQATPSLRPPPDRAVRASIVVPAYEAAGEIGETVRRLRSELGAAGEFEVVVVDDGSGDDTAGAARRAGADQVVVQPRNRGKGAAVRAGMLVARGRTLVFTDADLSYSPDQVLRVIEEVESGWDVVVGSRHHDDAVMLVRAGRLRELSGRVFNLFTSLVLLGRYRDTQCGLKGFRADVADLLFSQARIDGFAFDVEVLHLVERHRLSMTEVPVTLESSDASTVRVGVDALGMVRDLLRVRRLAADGAYDLAEEPALPPGRSV